MCDIGQMDRQGRNNMPLGEMLYLGKSLIGERRVHKSHKAISRFKGKKAILICQALYLRAIADSSLYPKNHLCFKSQWKWFIRHVLLEMPCLFAHLMLKVKHLKGRYQAFEFTKQTMNIPRKQTGLRLLVLQFYFKDKRRSFTQSSLQSQ